MASLRDIRGRITSVKNTRQITKAMKLVATAKLARATQAAKAAKPYSQTLTRVLVNVVAAAGDVEHTLLNVPDNDTDVVVVLLTADRGLCGNFNNAVCRATQEKVDALIAEGKKVSFFCYGKKGRAYFERRGYTIAESTVDLAPAAFAGFADSLTTRLVADMEKNSFSTVYLAYNEFKSVLTQRPTFEQILPMKVTVAEGEESGAGGSGYLYEPAGQEILDRLLPLSVRTRFFQAFLETQAGEQAARMTAMDNSTRNASELIDRLTLEYNRARQAAITKELIEIISGAQAL
jgi:F-type H+-transporting ATPase subunit gamma